MLLVCYGFYLQAVTELKGISTNIKRKDGTWKITLAKHLLPGSDL